MTLRSARLARVLLARLRPLELAVLASAGPGQEADRASRQEVVAKVLLSEAGVFDGLTVLRVTDAIPYVRPGREPADGEIAELADFLEAHLPQDRL